MAREYAKTAVGATSGNFKELIQAIYDAVVASTDWQIKLDSTSDPTAVPDDDTGDVVGFVIQPAGGGAPNIAIAHWDGGATGALGGVTMVNGAGLAGGDGIVVGVDPTDTITSIMDGTGGKLAFAVGPDWSGWGIRAEGEVAAANITDVKFVFDTDFLAWRVKDGTGVGYEGGAILGQPFNHVGNFAADPFAIFSGAWFNWSTTGVGVNDEKAGYLPFSGGPWTRARIAPGENASAGFVGPGADDGIGGFRLGKVGVFDPQTPITLVESNWALIGLFKFIFCGPKTGAPSKEWDDSGATFGFNINGGCHVWADDGVNPE